MALSQRCGWRSAVFARSRLSANVENHGLVPDHDLETLRTFLKQNKSCKFVPPKMFGTINVASSEKDCRRHICSGKQRLALVKVVDVAVVKAKSQRVWAKRTRHEIAHEITK